MTTLTGVRRPLAALVAAAMCGMLVALLFVGVAMLLAATWSAARDTSPYEPHMPIVATGTAIGAVLMAAGAAVLVWAAVGMFAGTPRATGRAVLAGAGTLVLAMTFGILVDTRLASALAAGAVALVLLVSLRALLSK